MTQTELDAMRERLEAATPGPWYVRYCDDEKCQNMTVISDKDHGAHDGCFDNEEDTIAITFHQCFPRVAADEPGESKDWKLGRYDSEFIACAPSDIASLLAEVERQQVENNALKERNAELKKEAVSTYYNRLLNNKLGLLPENSSVHFTPMTIHGNCAWEHSIYTQVNDTDQTVLNFSVRQTGMNPDEVIKKRVQDLAEKMFGAILSHDVLVGEVEKLKDEYKQLDTKFIAALGYCATAEEQRREEVRKLNAQIEGLTAERDHYRVALSKAAAGPWIESSVERPNEYGMYFIEVNYLDYVGHFGADDMKYYDERGVSHYPDKYRWARINAGAK